MVALDKIRDRGSDECSNLSVYIVTRKQRQSRQLGSSSQIDCGQCLLVRMAHSDHCQGIIMFESVCPWIYNVLMGNNTLLEATVGITDRKAFICWFLLNGIVIIG